MSRRCYCKVAEPTYCADCGTPLFGLTEEDLEDVLNAMSFFISNFPQEAAEAKGSMRGLTKRLWKMRNHVKECK
jgi:hypothetical protein